MSSFSPLACSQRANAPNSSPTPSSTFKSPQPHPASNKVISKWTPGRTSPPPKDLSPTNLECHLWEHFGSSSKPEVLCKLPRGALTYMGRSQLHNDACLLEQHMRMQFSRTKAAIMIELLASTPAYYWRRGSDSRLQLLKGKPVELFHGDRFTFLHDLHPIQLSISEPNRSPTAATDNEKVGLLSDSEPIELDFRP
eukprot:NODE_1515_length_874_cov_203.745455_g1174_i0.p1 GENE.NODE_1515_length_874_cov_203.745455_g1174_i0~~NODE_1515_length_874_cov_203.745455_g1174_i0.p1  ORF type:complete len:216 (-),score=68.14 NODE_1515_length_874_cov_203.745455_g1174_i0:226-813(-)